MKRTKMQKGITLIALIITIIILLILAVVTIGSIKNSNIITYAQNASTDYEKAKNDEEGIISNYESIIKENLPGGEKVTYIGDVPIPAGFKHVDGETIDDGIVIENKTEGSQFVWVPVPDITKFAKLQSGSEVNYEGILYDFDTTSTTEMKDEDYGIGTNGYREPDVLTKLYNQETGEYEDVLISKIVTTYLEKAGMPAGSTSDDFKEQLQKEFNEMVESVAKYKGFYVGRYETSVNGTVPQSKCGVTSVTAADNDNTWYGLYALNKKYTTSSVKSSMIWGSQYDAMMLWMGNDVTNFDTNNINEGRETGSESTDIIRNVYDLGGNSLEWTIEALIADSRVLRGGFYTICISPYNRSYDFSTLAHITFGSRLTLYIV